MLVVHDEETLLGAILHVVLDALAVKLKCHEFSACQLIDFLLCDLIILGWVQLDLEYLVHTTTILSEEDLLVIASDQMPSDHGLWLANQLEEVAIERCLYYAVVELNYKHVLFLVTKSLCYQVARLHFVVVVPLLVLDVICKVLLDLVAIPVFRGNDANITAEDEEGLLADV